MFGLNDGMRLPPTVTQRRENRVSLKSDLLLRYWNEEPAVPPENKLKLIIPQPLKRKLSDNFTLETDIWEVIAHLESTGNIIIDAVSGNRMGHYKIGHFTYWVEYKAAGGEILSSLTHTAIAWRLMRADMDEKRKLICNQCQVEIKPPKRVSAIWDIRSARMSRNVRNADRFISPRNWSWAV
jgi:hypothetical protein